MRIYFCPIRMKAGVKQAEAGGETKQRADFTTDIFKYLRPYFVPFLKIYLSGKVLLSIYGGHGAMVNTFM